MAVVSYHLASGATRWYFVIDLPPDVDGRRRQRKQRGFTSRSAAQKAEQEAAAAYGEAALSADGSVNAELDTWVTERELDVQETTSATTATSSAAMLPPTSAPVSCTHSTSASYTTYTEPSCNGVAAAVDRCPPRRCGWSTEFS